MMGLTVYLSGAQPLGGGGGGVLILYIHKLRITLVNKQ